MCRRLRGLLTYRRNSAANATFHDFWVGGWRAGWVAGLWQRDALHWLAWTDMHPVDALAGCASMLCLAALRVGVLSSMRYWAWVVAGSLDRRGAGLACLAIWGLVSGGPGLLASTAMLLCAGLHWLRLGQTVPMAQWPNGPLIQWPADSDVCLYCHVDCEAAAHDRGPHLAAACGHAHGNHRCVRVYDVTVVGRILQSD